MISTQRLVEESTDVVVVVGTDGRFEYVSPSVERLLGYDPDDLLGADSTAFVHPADRERSERRFERLIAQPDRVLSDELRLRHADGSWVWVENRGRNLLDDPTVGGIVISARDITARKRREQRLKHYEAILENMDDVAYTIDDALVVTYANDRALAYAERSYDEVVGQSVTTLSEEMLGSQANVDRFLGAIRAVVDGDAESERLELAIEVPQGTVYAELQVSLLQPLDSTDTDTSGTLADDEDGVDTDGASSDGEATSRGAVVISWDITTRHEQARELKQQNERLDTFASVVSHDLRNPLAVASGNLELARSECDSERLDAVETALGRMDELVEDLLTLAQHGERRAGHQWVDLDEVATSCWELVETGDATATFDSELTVRADESRLRQFLTNLFRNSVEHGSTADRLAADDAVEHGSTADRSPHRATTGGSAGGVTVRLGALDGTDGDRAAGDRDTTALRRGFYVEDDGPGIPVEAREDVFEAGHSTVAGGTGIGLMIVDEIAEDHGWDVTITDGETGGARFEVRNVAVQSATD